MIHCKRCFTRTIVRFDNENPKNLRIRRFLKIFLAPLSIIRNGSANNVLQATTNQVNITVSKAPLNIYQLFHSQNACGIVLIASRVQQDALHVRLWVPHLQAPGEPFVPVSTQNRKDSPRTYSSRSWPQRSCTACRGGARTAACRRTSGTTRNYTIS